MQQVSGLPPKNIEGAQPPRRNTARSLFLDAVVYSHELYRTGRTTSSSSHPHLLPGGDDLRTDAYLEQVYDLESGNNLAQAAPLLKDWGTTAEEQRDEQQKQKEQSTTLNSTSLPFWLQWPFFWFPYNVNEWSARFVAFQVGGLAILSIIARNERWNNYIWCAVFGDFCLRFLAGGRASLCGTLAEIPAHFLPRSFVPGAPKQFAALCGVIFAGFTALAYFEEEDDEHAGGTTIVSALLVCCVLEAVFNFCVGCFFFVLANKVGLISDSYRLKASRTLNEYEQMRHEMEEDRVKPTKESHTKKKAYSLPLAGSQGRALEFSYKTTTDAEKRGDFDLIRHVQLYYFAMPMGSLGLAITWKFASEGNSFAAHVAVWKGLAVVSAILFGSLFILYALKCVLYRRKVVKEWHHPTHHFAFVLVPTCILLFIPLTVNEYRDLAEVFFWIAAPLVLFLGLLSITRLIYYPNAAGHLKPMIMMPALANLIAAMTLPVVHTSYREAAFLWFGIATFLWVVLSAVTLQRVISMPSASMSEGDRAGLWIYVAAPAIICAAFVSITEGWSPFAYATFYITLCMFIILFLLTLGAYFGRERWSMSYWLYVFPLAALAFVCNLYFALHDSPTMQGVTTVAMILANALGAISLAHTLLALVKKTIFVPPEKFQPAALFRLQHRAVEVALARMDYGLVKMSLNSPDLVAEFGRLLSELELVMQEHTKHEEYIIYPAFRAIWPGLVDAIHAEHAEMEQAGAESHLLQQFEQWKSGGPGSSDVLLLMQKQFHQYATLIKKHFRTEEDSLQAIGRKYVSIQESIQVIRRAFFYTPLWKWRQILHFQLTVDFHHQRKIRFLKALAWSLPDKIQLIGKLVYESVDQFQFQRLCVDIPELAPRYAEDYQRWF